MLNENKKCPKCGEEIPVEMQFCLHCMQRTDGVLEIKQKTSKKHLILLSIIIILLLIVAGILILKPKYNNSINTLTNTTTSTIFPATSTISTTVSNQQKANSNSKESTVLQTSQTDNINFQDKVRNGLNSWQSVGFQIDEDTLSFSDYCCSFSANSTGEPLSCTLETNSKFNAYTLTIKETGIEGYSPSIYVHSFVETFSFVILDYSFDFTSDTLGDIQSMFLSNPIKTSGEFSENNFNCKINVTANDRNLNTITISAYFS